MSVILFNKKNLLCSYFVINLKKNFIIIFFLFYFIAGFNYTSAMPRYNKSKITPNEKFMQTEKHSTKVFVSTEKWDSVFRRKRT